MSINADSPRLGRMNEQVESPPASSSILRTFALFAPLFWTILGITLLSFPQAAQHLDPFVRETIAFVLVFILPGFFLMRALLPPTEMSGVSELPIAFSFSLGLFAIPAVVLSLLHAEWKWFNVFFALTLIVGGVLYLTRLPHAPRSRTTSHLPALGIAFGFLLLLAGYVALRAPRDGDDWLYLSIVQQRVHSDVLGALNIWQPTGWIRWTLQDWLFLQAFAERMLGVEPIHFLQDFLPTVLAPISLLSVYSLSRTFFNSPRAGLLAVIFQLAICLTEFGLDGWGRAMFARIAQDKFLMGFVLLPIALSFFWRFFLKRNFTGFISFGISVLAIAAVHPLGIAILALPILFFGIWHLLNQPATARRDAWLIALPLLALAGFTVVARQFFAPFLFTFTSPYVQSWIDLNERRMLLSSPLLYTLHPVLLDHPLKLFAIGLTPMLMIHWRRHRVAQFLAAAMVGTLAVTYSPLLPALLGQMITPWELWRVAWVLPIALVLTFFANGLWERFRQQGLHAVNVRRVQAKFVTFLFIAFIPVGLGHTDFLAAGQEMLRGHKLPNTVQGVMQALREQAQTPNMVLAPPSLSRLPPAFSANARVLTPFSGHDDDFIQRGVRQFYATQLFDTNDITLVVTSKAHWLIIEKTNPLNDQLYYMSEYFSRGTAIQTFSFMKLSTHRD